MNTNKVSNSGARGYLYTYLAVIIAYVIAAIPTSLLMMSALLSFVNSDSNDLSGVAAFFVSLTFVGILWAIIVLLAGPVLAFLFLKKQPARNQTAIILLALSACTPFVFYFANILNQETLLTGLWLLAYPGLARLAATKTAR